MVELQTVVESQGFSRVGELLVEARDELFRATQKRRKIVHQKYRQPCLTAFFKQACAVARLCLVITITTRSGQQTVVQIHSRIRQAWCVRTFQYKVYVSTRLKENGVWQGLTTRSRLEPTFSYWLPVTVPYFSVFCSHQMLENFHRWRHSSKDLTYNGHTKYLKSDRWETESPIKYLETMTEVYTFCYYTVRIILNLNRTKANNTVDH